MARFRTSIDLMNEHGLTLAKARSRRYLARTFTDADYVDDIALLADTPAQAEFLLHSLERTASDKGLHVNANKTEYMCFNQNGDISTLKGDSLKLVDNYTYLGSSISYTENCIIRGLAGIAIARLSVIWKSTKIKRNFSLQWSCPHYCMDTPLGR